MDMGHQKRWSRKGVLSATIKWHMLYAHNQQEAKSKLLWQIGIIMHYWKRMHMSDMLRSWFSLACAHQVSEPSLATCPQKRGRLLWQCDKRLGSSMRVYECMHMCARSNVLNGQKQDECNCATAPPQLIFTNWNWLAPCSSSGTFSLSVRSFIKISPRLH